jgi:hypothetical protein
VNEVAGEELGGMLLSLGGLRAAGHLSALCAFHVRGGPPGAVEAAQLLLCNPWMRTTVRNPRLPHPTFKLELASSCDANGPAHPL